jgi:hypothetical protein
MSEDDSLPPTRDEMDASREPPPRRRRVWPWIALLSVVLVPSLMFALWAAITLNYSFSEGTRTGNVLKLSHRGWICKTWEGELSMVPTTGVLPERWEFSVRSDSIARRIQELQGQQVQLDYEEHKGVPTSCFGDTRYFVVAVRPLAGGFSAPPPSPPPPPSR